MADKEMSESLPDEVVVVGGACILVYMNNADTIEAARDRVEDLIEDHSLYGWTFVIDHAKNRVGQCRYTSKEIGISLSHLQYGTPEAIEDTITHEIAHAIAGHGEGHGPRWASVHRSLGGSAEKYADRDEGAPTYRYEAVCAHCNKTALARRWRVSAKLKDAKHPACGNRVTWVDVSGGPGNMKIAN